MHKRMDWRTVKFDWNQARGFLVTAEEGSLSAAARALGMAQPTLGRQVKALEDELGVVLFERAGRGLVLTQSGLELLDHVRKMGEAATHVSMSASGQSQSVDGTVSISASDIYSSVLLPPILRKLRISHPGITVEVIASNTVSNLRRREADIAIRNFRPSDPDLIAKKIRDVPARFYATPDYLDSIGNPVSPADLSNADFVSIDSSGGYLEALNRMGMNLTERNFPIVTENYNVMWAMVKCGLGIGVLDGNIGDAEASVTRVLPDLKPLTFPIWLVAHRELGTSRRIRVVFDLLAADLAGIGP